MNQSSLSHAIPYHTIPYHTIPYVHTYIHTYVHAYIHACIHTYVRVYKHMMCAITHMSHVYTSPHVCFLLYTLHALSAAAGVFTCSLRHVHRVARFGDADGQECAQPTPLVLRKVLRDRLNPRECAYRAGTTPRRAWHSYARACTRARVPALRCTGVHTWRFAPRSKVHLMYMNASCSEVSPSGTLYRHLPEILRGTRTSQPLFVCFKSNAQSRQASSRKLAMRVKTHKCDRCAR